MTPDIAPPPPRPTPLPDDEADVAAATVQRATARPRIKPCHEPPMPLFGTELNATKLRPIDRAVVIDLWLYIWSVGRLPADPKQLAAIAGVGLRTFLTMRERIEVHFDIDVDGRWRHDDLEAQRAAAFAAWPGVLRPGGGGDRANGEAIDRSTINADNARRGVGEAARAGPRRG